MSHHTVKGNRRIAALAGTLAIVGSLLSAPATADDDLVVDGLLEQITESRGTLKVEQRFNLGGLAGINVVGASGDLEVEPGGRIRQRIDTNELVIEQRFSAGGVACGNCAISGLPGIGGPVGETIAGFR